MVFKFYNSTNNIYYHNEIPYPLKYLKLEKTVIPNIGQEVESLILLRIADGGIKW